MAGSFAEAMTTARIERPVATGARWSRRLGGFSFVLFVTVSLAHRYGLVGTLDLPPLFGTALVFAFAGLLAGLVAHRRYWYFGDQGGAEIFAGLFWSVATMTPFLIAGWWLTAYPRLYDISTDPESPPAMHAAERLRTPEMSPIVPPTPQSIIEQAEHYPLIEGRRYELPIDRVLAAVQTIVGKRGWGVTGMRDTVGGSFETTVEALAHSPLLALPADVAIRLTDEGTSTFVDMRSVSRYGSHDLGGNAARIAGLLAELDEALSGQERLAPAAPEEPAVETPDAAPPPTEAPPH